MQIKTFRAKNLQDALEAVRTEFGNDARIMHTREVDEPKFFGLVRNRIVEITATRGRSETEVSEYDDPSGGSSFVQLLQESPYDDVAEPPEIPFRFRTEIHAESEDAKFRPVPVGHWRRMPIEALNPTVLQRNLIARLHQKLRFGGPIGFEPGKRKIVAFIGPTGAGKTATITKLATHYRLKEGKRIGLLSVDTVRLGASEQLEKYAETLDVPLEVVVEPNRISQALGRFGTCDLVLLDTPGANPKNISKLQFLGAALDAAEVDETFLVLSATSSSSSLLDAMKRFESLGATGLTLTKMDELVSLRDLYYFLKEVRLPLRFLGTGQNISNDLEVAGPVRLAAIV